MHPILLESPVDDTHRGPLPCPDEPSSYDSILLRESIDRFLASIRDGSRDLSAFRSIFSRLIQSRPDPPLEIVWFYAAVVHHDALASKTAVLDRVAAVRDLLQLLIACSSASHGGAGCVSLVAPVVAELWHVAVEVVGMGGGRKARKEVESLVEGVMGYVGICGGRGGFGDSEGCGGLLPCFREVVRVWTVRRGGGETEMEWFFPLAGDSVRAAFDAGGCGVEDLAGVAAAQVFLLRVMMRLEGGGTAKPETTSELTAWAVGVLTGFGNVKSFEILMRLLLDSKLPTFPPSSAKHEATLRQILYDSTLLVEYSFLSPLKEVEKCDSLRHLAFLRLFVFHEAIQLARKGGNHKKAIAYTNAFSRSYIPSKLVQWINNQADRSNLTQPTASTPQALLKWLLSLEKQGFRVLKDRLRYHEKLHFDGWDSRTAEDHMVKADSQVTNEQLFFFDTKGDTANDEAEEDAMELAGDAFLSAARTMKSEKSSSKKRKGEKGKDRKAQAKYVKYKLHDDTIKDYFDAQAKAYLSSGIEVENPISDEDVDEMEE